MTSQCLTLLRQHLTNISKLLDALAELCRDYLDKGALEAIGKRARIYREAAANVWRLSRDEIMLLSSAMPVEAMKTLLETLERCARGRGDIELYLEVKDLKRELIDGGLYRMFLIRLHEACDPNARKIARYMLAKSL